MPPFDRHAQLIRWVGRNTAYNLGFIPEERLNWKPAGTASSAMEIASHVAGVLRMWTRVLGGQEWTRPEPAAAASLQEAQELISASAEEYATALLQVAPRELGRTVGSPLGPVPLARAAVMPLVDAIHHHGQIAYIQTLLGDRESHFLDG